MPIGVYARTLEHCANISAGKRGKKNPKISAYLRGRKQSPETIEKRTAKLRGRKRSALSAEHRAKISSAKRGKKQSLENVAKSRENQKKACKASADIRRGRGLSPDQLSSIREIQKRSVIARTLSNEEIVKPKHNKQLHYRIRCRYGIPDRCECPTCLGSSKIFEWCRKDHSINTLSREDWLMMCRSCHRKFDVAHNFYKVGFLSLVTDSKDTVKV